MSNYIGKHLLIDCYECRKNTMNDLDVIVQCLRNAAKRIGMTIAKEFTQHEDDELTAAVCGDRSYITIHCYPSLDFAAIDVYEFDNDLDPARAMHIFRKQFHPQKLRATSIKRGNIARKDTIPHSHNKTTTLRKFKKTGKRMVSVAKFIRHKKGEEELGPD